MSRRPVSVIVTASGSPDDFRVCLESLRSTLGVHDEVACVVPADRPDLRGTLRGLGWLAVLEDEPGDQIEIRSLFELRRHHEAAQRLRDCVRKGTLPVGVATMAEVLTADGSTVAELATLLPLSALRSLLLSASEAPDQQLVDELLEALDAVIDAESGPLLQEMRVLAPGIAAAVSPAGVG